MKFEQTTIFCDAGYAEHCKLRAEATVQQGEAGAYEPLGEPLFPSEIGTPANESE